ncbi:hypothetical protein AgCh_013382 [Apium graveolens]
MNSITTLKMRILLVITCMVSLNIVESFEPIPGQPLLQFSSDLAYKQKDLLQNWKDCQDAWLHTGGCVVDIWKLLHGIGGGVGGLPGGGGLPFGNPPAADAPAGGGGAAAPSGGASPAADTSDTVQDGDDDAAGGSGSIFPGIGSWFPGLGSGGLPGIGGGIPGVGGGIPGIGGGIPGIGGGLPSFGGPFSQVCCDALAVVQSSCPGLALNPFYSLLIGKHCAPH